MTVHTFYRACIWLPIVVPATVIALYTALQLDLAAGIAAEVLAYSLVYGGLPYAVLAAWATWWVGGRPEAEIRRLMFRAPLVMAGVFVPLAIGAGFVLGNRGPFAAVALLGGFLVLLLGYSYVGVAVLLRRVFDDSGRGFRLFSTGRGAGRD